MDLGMTVMASCDYIACLGGLNLVVLDFSVLQAFFLETGLEVTAAATAAEVITLVGIRIHKVFRADTRLDYKAEIICRNVAKAFSYYIAWVLNGEFNLKILVPLGTRLEPAFADPLCVVLIDGADFEVVRDVEFFQSGQD